VHKKEWMVHIHLNYYLVFKKNNSSHQLMERMVRSIYYDILHPSLKKKTQSTKKKEKEKPRGRTSRKTHSLNQLTVDMKPKKKKKRRQNRVWTEEE